MAGKPGKWPSGRGPISKIRPSDGCGRDTVPLAVGQWYDFHSVGCHLGNVGLNVNETRQALGQLREHRRLLAFFPGQPKRFRNQEGIL